MHDEPQLGGFLSGDAIPDESRERDPIEAVTIIAGLRDEALDNPPPAQEQHSQNTQGNADSGNDTTDDYGEFAWPDGYSADPEAIAKFIPLARKLGLPKEGAQELANLYADLDQRRQQVQAEFIAKNNAEWLREIQGHPEFGGKNLERTGTEVARMMRRYGSPLLMAQIRQMNVQNWPEMFYFLARVSQAVSEDCSPSGVGGAAPARSTAQLLFPGLK